MLIINQTLKFIQIMMRDISYIKEKNLICILLLKFLYFWWYSKIHIPNIPIITNLKIKIVLIIHSNAFNKIENSL